MQDKNTIIAQFMGLENHFKNEGVTKVFINENEYIQNWECYDTETENLITPIEMKYHTSWDWIIPVIEKIQDKHLENPELDYKYVDEIKLAVPNIQEVYYLVVEFIKIYNDENTHK